MIETELEAKPKAKPAPLWRKALQVAFGVALFVLVLYIAGLGNLEEIPSIDMAWVLIGGFFAGLAIIIFLTRWSTIVNALVRPIHVPRWHTYTYGIYSLVAGLLIMQTLSLVVVRSVALNRRDGVKLATAVASVIIDKLFDLLLVLAFVIPALWFISTPTALEPSLWLALGIFAVISVFLTVFTRAWLRFTISVVQWIFSLMESIPLLKRLTKRPLFQQVANVEAWTDVGASTIRVAYWLTILGEIALIARSWFVAGSVGLGDVPISAIALGVILSQAGILLALTPQGLGVVEAAWFLVMAGSGADGETVAVFLITHRLVASLTTAILGLSVYIISFFRK